VLGIKRHLQVDTKAYPLLIPLVMAAATEGVSKLLIIGRSLLIEPGSIPIFKSFLEMRGWKFFLPAILHEDNLQHGTDI